MLHTVLFSLILLRFLLPGPQLTLRQVNVTDATVNLWISQSGEQDELHPELLQVFEDDRLQPMVEHVATEQYALLHIVLRSTAAVKAEWLYDTTTALVDAIAPSFWLSLTICGADAKFTAAATYDHNSILDTLTLATNAGQLSPQQACDSATLNQSSSLRAENLNPLMHESRVVIGDPSNLLLEPTPSTWIIVPPEIPTSISDPHTITASVLTTTLQPLLNALQVQSQVIHLRYTSQALPGDHLVRIAYPDFAETQTMIALPILPPQVTLQAPNLANFANTGRIQLGINLLAKQSPLAKVEYFVDDAWIGESSSPPFELDWQVTLPPGEHRLHAIAHDQAGATAVTPPASFVTTLTRQNQPIPWLLITILASIMLISGILFITKRQSTAPETSNPSDLSSYIPILHFIEQSSGKRLSFAKPSIRIGSHEQHAPDIVIPDSAIALLHATIKQTQQGTFVEPHAAMTIGDQRIEPMARDTQGIHIQPGTRLGFGSTILVFEGITKPSSTDQIAAAAALVSPTYIIGEGVSAQPISYTTLLPHHSPAQANDEV